MTDDTITDLKNAITGPDGRTDLLRKILTGEVVIPPLSREEWMRAYAPRLGLFSTDPDAPSFPMTDL